MDLSIPDREHFESIWARVTGAEQKLPSPGSVSALAEAVACGEKLYLRAASFYRRQGRLFRRIAGRKRRQLAELQLMHFLAFGDTAGVMCAKPAPLPPSVIFLRERYAAENELAGRFERAAAEAPEKEEKELLLRLSRETRAIAGLLAREIGGIMR